MKTMYRGVFTALLAVLLTLFLSPAMAEGYGLFIAGTEVTSENCWNLSHLNGVLNGSNPVMYYNPQSKVLTMKNVQIHKGDCNSIFNEKVDDLTIEVEGFCYLHSATVVDAVRFNRKTTITGGGYLKVEASNRNSAVYVYQTTLLLSNVTLEANAKWGILGDNNSGELTIRDATVYARTTNRNDSDRGAIRFLNSCKLEGESRFFEPNGARWDGRRFHAVVNDAGHVATNVRVEPNLGLFIAGTPVTSKNCNNLSNIPGVQVASEFKYDPASKTLTMNGVKIDLDKETLKEKIAIRNKRVTDLTIRVSGNNYLTTKKEDALRFDVSTKLTGSGTLTAKSTGNTHSGAYILNGATLSIVDVAFNAEGKHGIFGESGSHGELSIQNATVNAKGEEDAIADLASMTLEIAKITAPVNGRWDADKHAVMDGNQKAREVKIKPSYSFSIAGVEITDENVNQLNKLPGVAQGSELKYDPKTHTLTMKDVTMTLDGKIALHNTGHPNLKIEFVGNNKITTTNADCLRFDADTKIIGSGKLSLKTTSNNSGIYVPRPTFTLEGITLDIEGKFGILGDEVYGLMIHRYYGTLIIRNAIVTTKTTESAICNLEAFRLEGSEIVVPKGASWNDFRHNVTKGGIFDIVKDLTIAPAYGFAIAGVEVTAANIDKLEKIDGVTVSEGGKLKYDPESKTLTMKKLKIDVNDKTALSNQKVKDLTIEVLGDVDLFARNAVVFRCEAATTIKGNGWFYVFSRDYSDIAVSIPTATTLTLENCRFSAYGRHAIMGDNGEKGSLRLRNVEMAACAPKEGASISNLVDFTLEKCDIVFPKGASWNREKHAVMDGSKVANDVSIARNLSLFPGALVEVPKTGDTKRITFVSDKPWTLTLDPADATWVTPSATSGTGTQAVTFTVVKNETTAARSVKAIFTQADTNKTRELEIKQAAGDPIFLLQPETLAEVSKEGGKPSVTLTSNKAWTLKLNPADATWVTPSATSGMGTQEVTFTVAKNETTAARSVKAIFTQADTKTTRELEIKQAAGEAIFTLNPETLAEVSKEGGAPNVTLTSNKAWTLKLDPADAGWVTASATEGTGTQEVTFTVAKNETAAARSVKAIFTQADTKKTREVEIKQAAGDPIFLLQPETLAEVAKEGGKPSVTLTSNKSWTLALDPADATAWVTPSTSNGTGTQAVTFTVVKNETTEARSVKATFTQADTKKTRELEIKQAAGDPIFLLQPETLAEVSKEGGSPSVTLTSNKAWTLKLDPADAGWVTASATEGTGTQAVTFTVAKNETAAARNVKAIFTQADTEKTLELEVKQAAGDPIFLLQPETLEEVSKEGGAPSVTLTSNKAWTLTLDPADATAWVTPSASNGTGTQEVTFTVARNEATTSRTVVVTFKQAETEKELQLTITQGAAESVQVPLIGISFTETNVSLKVGMSTTLVVKYNPDNATNKEVTWEVTEGTTSLSVDANGKITATNVAGTAKVKAMSKEGGHTAECTVTVTTADVPVESIAVSPAVVNLTVGGTQQLSVSVNPRTATNQTATWAVTAGAGIVSVNGTGLVKALKAGTAKVTATVGGKTATCTVNVKAKDAPTVPKAVEDAVLASVVVAPNPFTSQLRLLNPEGVAVHYVLIDASGVVLLTGALDGTETVVDTEALAAGLYFVRFRTANSSERSVKVVKH
ncbi:MAG: BACON domain-containing protein [Bacteroides sp.]